MLFCFGLFALLLYNTVVANAVCSFTYSKKDKINASSLAYEKEGYAKCEYVIKAPRNSYIVLNLTDLIGFRWYPGHGGSSTTDTNSQTSDYSFTESSDKHLNNNCLPPELIIQETFSGKEATRNRICNSQNYKIPHVFHSKSNLLKIIYIWVREERSGFSLDFDFHQKNNNCAFKCDNSKCLSSTLVCNEEYNCVDKTDEINCSQNQNKGASTYVIKIVVIVISVVLMPVLAALVCVASPCRSTSRMWRWRRSRDGGSVEHEQLRPRSQDSGVVYVPASSSTTQDLLEQKELQRIRERNILAQSAQTTLKLGVPPQIQISKDGEEGYAASQKQLLCHQKNIDKVYQECHKAPPNKTVYDKDSPPPYSSRSVSSVDSLGHSGMSSRRGVSDCNGYSVMPQCCNNNMSNSNPHHNHSSLQVHKSSRTKTASSSPPSSAAGMRHSRNKRKSSKNCLDQPPDYNSVISASSDIYNQSSSDDGV